MTGRACFRRRTAVAGRFALAATIALAGLPVATRAMPVSASGYTLSLSASSTTSAAGTPVTLTATSNQDVAGSSYDIQIWDQTTGGFLELCNSGTVCTTQVVEYTTTSHTYIAYIAPWSGTMPQTNIQATSNTVTVSFSGSLTWTLTLATSSSTQTAGQSVTLTATANRTITGTGYAIHIFDHTTGSYVTACLQGLSCYVYVSKSITTTHTFIAYIAPYPPGGGDPPPGVQVTSNTVTVTWTAPSDACASGQMIFDGYISGAYLRLRDVTSGTQTLVCYRVISTPTGDLGGNIGIVTAVPQVGTPTTDNNYQACQAAGAVPLVNGFVLGQPLYLDAYTSTNLAWVCVQMGPVQTRLIAQASVSGTPSVVQNVDPAGLPVPAPAPGPAGYPSSTCQGSGGAASAQLLDANVGGTQAWLSAWQVSSTQVDVCARIAGPTAAGGLITLTVPPVPALPSGIGLQPVFSTSASVSPACSTVITQFTQPTFAEVATSAPNQVNPAVVCVGLGSVVESVTVGITGTLSLPPPPLVPLPTVTLDPDTA